MREGKKTEGGGDRIWLRKDAVTQYRIRISKEYKIGWSIASKAFWMSIETSITSGIVII